MCFITGSMRTVPIPESPSPPPPPPPRPSDTSPNSTPSHSQNNQSTNSANDSKESNEISEAECDRDPLISTNVLLQIQMIHGFIFSTKFD